MEKRNIHLISEAEPTETYLEQNFRWFKNFHSLEIQELRNTLSTQSNAGFGGKILTSMFSEILASAPDDFRFIVPD